MKVARSVAEARSILEERWGTEVAFVPTMGALHEGHRSLLRAARSRSSTYVVLSVFVNPLQFGPSEDLSRYPRDEAGDLEIAEVEGVDLVFVPSVDEMYPAGASTRITVGPIGDVLEGASRPGHFDGVATVVAKLFNIVRPQVAYFGQKDAQQVAVIRAMVRDLDFPLRIQVEPIVREPDGLALSTRNAYLSGSERGAALALSRALNAGAAFLREEDDPDAAAKEMWRVFTAEPEIVADYAVAVDPDDMGRPRAGEPVLLAVAATVGSTRLIDNVLIARG